MKKLFISLSIVTLLAAFTFAGCGKNMDTDKTTSSTSSTSSTITTTKSTTTSKATDDLTDKLTTSKTSTNTLYWSTFFVTLCSINI